MTGPKNLLLAGLRLALGLGLGLMGFEALLHANPGLLLRGMGLPAPVDPPLTVQEYDVRYSDADVFFWHADLIRPIPPEQDRVEAHVRFETDEFGFPNPGPLPETVDVVILGRSYSLGAQAANPWPRLLAAQAGLQTLNLSQAGSEIDIKLGYLRHFGLPRRPKWIVIEVLPSMDIIGYGEGLAPLLVERLPFPIAQGLARRAIAGRSAYGPGHPVYPLAVDVPGRTVRLTFYSYYLSALSVDRDTLAASRQWTAYRDRLLDLVELSQRHSACVILLYAPTKSAIYFPLATNPDQLAPTLAAGWAPWRLSPELELTPDPDLSLSVSQMQANASAAREVLAAFADEHHLTLVDPSVEMTDAALNGDRPFMAYDTHWSATGHQITARLVANALQREGCP